jgi:hypothetical protein
MQLVQLGARLARVPQDTTRSRPRLIRRLLDVQVRVLDRGAITIIHAA